MFKKRAAWVLDNLTSERPRELPAANWPENKQRIIAQLEAVIESEDFKPAILFIAEFSRRPVEVSFGFLYEPIPGITIPELKGIARYSKKEKSPYFCAKIPLAKMGHAFLIPISGSPFEYVLVIRQERKFRQPFVLAGKKLPGCSFSLLLPPLYDLDYTLLQLAILNQAHLR